MTQTTRMTKSLQKPALKTLSRTDLAAVRGGDLVPKPAAIAPLSYQDSVSDNFCPR
jgi:hypothetical protein